MCCRCRHLLTYDVVPDAVDGANVGRVAGQGCHVGHARIHIGGAHRMAHGLVLINNRLVGLRVFVYDGGLSAIVEQKFCLVEILLVARNDVELGQSHFRDLVAGHYTCLPLVGTYLATHTVGISDGNVEEFARPRGLIMGDSCFHHVSKVIELVAQVFLLHPALGARPFVGVCGVHGACRIEISVRLLCGSNDIEHRVDVGLQFLVGIGLQEVAGALNGFVWVGVVK